MASVNSEADDYAKWLALHQQEFQPPSQVPPEAYPPSFHPPVEHFHDAGQVQQEMAPNPPRQFDYMRFVERSTEGELKNSPPFLPQQKAVEYQPPSTSPSAMSAYDTSAEGLLVAGRSSPTSLASGFAPSLFQTPTFVLPHPIAHLQWLVPRARLPLQHTASTPGNALASPFLLHDCLVDLSAVTRIPGMPLTAPLRSYTSPYIAEVWIYGTCGQQEFDPKKPPILPYPSGKEQYFGPTNASGNRFITVKYPGTSPVIEQNRWGYLSRGVPLTDTKVELFWGIDCERDKLNSNKEFRFGDTPNTEGAASGINTETIHNRLCINGALMVPCCKDASAGNVVTRRRRRVYSRDKTLLTKVWQKEVPPGVVRTIEPLPAVDATEGLLREVEWPYKAPFGSGKEQGAIFSFNPGFHSHIFRTKNTEWGPGIEKKFSKDGKAIKLEEGTIIVEEVEYLTGIWCDIEREKVGPGRDPAELVLIVRWGYRLMLIIGKTWQENKAVGCMIQYVDKASAETDKRWKPRKDILQSAGLLLRKTNRDVKYLDYSDFVEESDVDGPKQTSE